MSSTHICMLKGIGKIIPLYTHTSKCIFLQILPYYILYTAYEKTIILLIISALADSDCDIFLYDI